MKNPMNLQFFAEETQDTPPADQTAQDQTQQADQKAAEPDGKEPPKKSGLDLNELLKDKDFQSWFDRETSKKTDKAVAKALEKQRLLMDSQLSEEKKEAMMSKEELAEYKIAKAEAKEREAEKRIKQVELKGLANELLASISAPEPVSKLVRALATSEEELKDWVLELSDFEFLKKGEFEHHPIGTLDKLVQEAVEKRVQKKDPENHATSTNTSVNPWKRGASNLAEQTRIFRENPELARQMAAAEGITLPK